MDNWISVEKQMPQEGQEVICYNGVRSVVAIYKFRIGEFRIGKYQFVVQKYSADGFDRSIITCWDNVTHWMPMPAAPGPVGTSDKEVLDDFLIKLAKYDVRIRRKIVMLQRYLTAFKGNRQGVMPE